LNLHLASVHLSAVLFGMTGILGSVIHADAEVITFGRALFAVLTLTPVLWFWSTKTAQTAQTAQTHTQPHSQPRTFELTATQVFWRCGLSGTVLAIHWVTFFISVQTGGVAIATLGFSSFAAFITLIEYLLAPRSISRADWIRTLVVTLGLVIITPSLELSHESTYGFVMGLISGLSFALMAVLNSRSLRGVNPIRVARNQNLVVFAIMLPLAYAGLPAVDGLSWLWLMLLGVFCTGLSHSLFVYSLAHLRVHMAGLVIALEPVYAIAAAWLLFADIPAWRTLVGGVVIVSAIMGIGYAQARHRP
jgi:drug/metabolite transporter (DMT)-like permease